MSQYPDTTSGRPGAADQTVRQAVERALGTGRRVFGEGGIAQQIVAGDWDGQFTDASARDAADRWDALAEHIRATRSDPHADIWELEPSTDWLCGLPLNRKERYYTGTVLPGLIGSDGFAHLGRFLALCGLDPRLVSGGRRDDVPNLLFCTEYGFAESVFTESERQRWGHLDADTPDVVLAGPDWLLAVEAKMFHNPTAGDLNRQMQRQAALIDRWVEVLEISRDRVAHVLLLPAQLADATAVATTYGWDVVTWQDVLEEFAHVGARYWANVLATALSDYSQRVSVGPAFGKNKDASLTGAQIVDLHAEGSLEYLFVGRSGGQGGPAFHDDVTSGTWRTRHYEVSSAAKPPNSNWFAVAEFIAAISRG